MSTDAPTVDDFDADTIAFGECDCDDPVPDPEHLELPNGAAVQILACAACGDAIDWDIGGRPEDELRELVRDKQATIRDLRDTIVAKDERIDELEGTGPAPAATTPIEDRETRLITSHGQDRVEKLETEVTSLRNQIDLLDEANYNLEEERQELADEVERLEADLAEARNTTPLWRRAMGAVANTRAVGTMISVLVTVFVTWLVWPVANEAALTIERNPDVVGEPIVQLSPVGVGVSALVAVVMILAIKIGPKGVGSL